MEFETFIDAHLSARAAPFSFSPKSRAAIFIDRSTKVAALLFERDTRKKSPFPHFFEPFAQGLAGDTQHSGSNRLVPLRALHRFRNQ